MPFQIREKNLEELLSLLARYRSEPEDLRDLEGFTEIQRSQLRERCAIEHTARLLQDVCRKEGHTQQVASLVWIVLPTRRLPDDWLLGFNLLEDKLRTWPKDALDICRADCATELIDPAKDVVINGSLLDLTQWKPEFELYWDTNAATDRQTGEKFVFVTNAGGWESCLVHIVRKFMAETQSLVIDDSLGREPVTGVAFEHDQNYRNIRWSPPGERTKAGKLKAWSLSPAQAAMMQALHKAWESGFPDVPNLTLLDKAGRPDSSDPRDTFKNTANEDLWGIGKLIVPGKRNGTRRLNLNNVDSDSQDL
jgi:hypothetical protein